MPMQTMMDSCKEESKQEEYMINEQSYEDILMY